MAAARRFLMTFMIVGVVAIIGGALVKWYPYIFSRRVVGKVIKVERVEYNVAVLQADPSARVNPQVFSFAVAIKDQKTGEIVTASAEDRQWAVVQSGQCAEAVYYPYPPWRLDKANTYFGARLEKLSDCEEQKADQKAVEQK